MRTTLLRILLMLSVITGVSISPVLATHLLGGEMSYQYLDANGPATAPFRYRLTMTIYYNADPLTSRVPAGRGSVTTFIYDRVTGQRLLTPTLPRTQNAIISPATTRACAVVGNGTAVQVRLNRFESIVSLPYAANGYYAYYVESNRNNDITNIVSPENDALVLYTDMAAPSLPNSSPVFSDTAVAVICRGDTSIIINNAFDADGDRLEYSFGTPYGGTVRAAPTFFAPPPPLITYPAGYSVAQPFGPTQPSYAFLDKNTGFSRYLAPALGKYVVAVDVREYRLVNGQEVLIGTTRRDVQLVARMCEPNQPPVFTSTTPTAQEYTLLEGQPLNLNVAATDPEGQNVTLRATSVLLDGVGGFEASFNDDPGTLGASGGTGTVSVTGKGSAAGQFCFTPACGAARGEPYDLIVTAFDDGCNSKSTAVIYRIRVIAAPTAIVLDGSRSVCPTAQGVVYSVRDAGSTSYQWTVVGGTIASGQGTSRISVNWGAATNANASVSAVGTTAYGCPTAPSLLPVVIDQQLATETPTGPARACLGSTYTYQTQYTNGSSYAWQITGGTQVSTNLASVQVRWDRVGPARLVVTETSSPSGAVRCRGVSQPLLVEVVPAPATNLVLAGPDRVCADNGPVTFTLPGFATSTYEFLLLNTVTQQATPLPTTSNSVTLPTPAVGAYTITARETSACAGPLYAKPFVVDPLPAAVAIAGPARVCPENLRGLRYSLAGLMGSAYQWTITGGSIVSGQGTNTITVDFADTTIPLAIAVVETSAYGCVGVVNTLVVRPDNVRIALQVGSVSLTNDRHAVLTLQAPNNADNAQRIAVQRRVANSEGAFVVVGEAANTATTYTDATADTDAQAYDYRLSLTNACGTELLSTVHTLIHTTALATEATGGRTEGSVLVQWSFYQGFAVQQYEVYRVADQGVSALVATVPATTARVSLPTSTAGFGQCFRVKAIGTGGLASYSNDACVEFANKLLLYNIITPNGDGLNDVFFVDNVALYPGNTLTIFDRWGKEVYSTHDYRNTWNGANTGSGTHYYLFKVASGAQYKGWFEIVK